MKKTVGFDLETSSSDPLTCEIACIQLYIDGESRIYPVKMKDMDPIDPRPILREIAEKYKVIGHRLYFDLLVSKRYGVDITPVADSALLFAQTPESATHPRDSRGLKDLAVLS